MIDRKGQADRGVRTDDSGVDDRTPKNDAGWGDEGVDDPAAGVARPTHDANQTVERRREERGNRGPDDVAGFGQGG